MVSVAKWLADNEPGIVEEYRDCLTTLVEINNDSENDAKRKLKHSTSTSKMVTETATRSKLTRSMLSCKT